jgi:hypothetical protein
VDEEEGQDHGQLRAVGNNLPDFMASHPEREDSDLHKLLDVTSMRSPEFQQMCGACKTSMWIALNVMV